MAEPSATAPSQAQTPISKGAWGITILLLLYMLVNFADKIVVGLAGVPIMTELKLSQTEFGFLGSAFFFLFSTMAILVGFVLNKVQARWVLLGLAAVWALVQFPMVGTVSYTTLLICRIILGAGEGPASAVALHAVYKWFPDEKRTMPTALISQGATFGVIFAVPTLNWVIVHSSWHAAFGVLGVAGLLWVVAWIIFGKEGPLTGKEGLMGRDEPHVPYSTLLTSPTFLGCIASTFGAYWALSLGLTWFTPFIVKGLGFSQSQAGGISILPWIFGAVMVISTGWISQRLLGNGMVTRKSRGLLGSMPLVLGGLVILLLPFVESTWGRIALLVVGTGLSGSIYVVCPPMIAEIAPVAQRGAMISLYGAFYTLAGVLAPTVMGRILDAAPTPLEGYLLGYKMLGVILIVSGLLGMLLLRPNADRVRIMAPVAA